MAGSYFTDLVAWQKSIGLSEEIYRITKAFPKDELYGLSSQMRRAVVSIPSNIAEGNQRASLREYIHFLYVAKGSLGELVTQIIVCERMEYIDKERKDQLIEHCFEVGRLLSGLINNLNSRLNSQIKQNNMKGKNTGA